MKKRVWQVLIMASLLILASEPALADLGSDGIMNTVLKRFDDAASSWAITLTAAASRLFWSLVLISLVWTGGQMLLRKADIGEFFAELFRFTVVTGFFWWLLTNAVTGMNIAGTVISSMQQLGTQAGGLGSAKLDPGTVIDIGFGLFDKTLVAVEKLGWNDWDMAIAMIFLGGVILAILALIAVNLLLLLATSWIVLYAGIFYLGFGGSRWTSDIAINYYRTILGIAVQLLTMILVIAIGKAFLEDFANQISSHTTIQELAVMMVVSIILFVLTDKVPATMAGIITGASVGNTGIGQLGAGAAIGAGAVAAGAFASGGVALAHGLEKAGVAGGGALSSLMAAFSQANANVASGSDVLTSMWGGGPDGGGGSDPSGGGPGGGGLPGTGDTPLAEAMGFGSSMGSTASTGGDNGGSAASGGGEAGDTVNSGGGESSGDGRGSSSSGGGDSNGNGSAPGTQQTASDLGSSSPKGGFMVAAAMAASTATKIAADAGANLAKGSGSIVKDKAANIKDSVKGAIQQTAGGKIASEIRNPGSTAQARQDKQDIAAASELRSQLQADEARDFLAEHSGAGSDSTPSFGDNSLSGEEADPQSEVAAFVNKDQPV